MREYDMIVIGAGSGNMVVTRAFDDWRVAIVEEGPFGGTCLNRGCIPSKMLVHTADLAFQAADGARFGLDTAFRGADWPAIRDRVFGRIDPDAAATRNHRLGQAHVDVYSERARFVGHKTLEVGPHTLTAPTIVVAAGSRPALPSIDGLDGLEAHTSDTIMRIDALPDRLLVIGGGYIGVELGHVFDAFGTEVTIVSRNERLLDDEDSEISARITDIYRERMDVRLGTMVTSARRRNDDVVFETADGDVTGDMVLVAAGRVPNGDLLGVAETGVETDPDGYVLTDSYGRTSVDGIWALGDVSSRVQLKHKANADARIVRHNIVHPDELRVIDMGPVPRAVFGNPQVASVGPTEDDLMAEGVPYLCTIRPYGRAAYGWAMEDTTSVIKLLAHAESRRLLAAHIIGPQASTLIQQLVQGMRFGQTVDEMARHQWYIHPALPEVVEQALLDL